MKLAKLQGTLEGKTIIVQGLGNVVIMLQSFCLRKMEQSYRSYRKRWCNL